MMRIAGAAFAALVLVGLVGGPAGAANCAMPLAPKATITGDGEMAMGGTFFDHYDGVIIGKVLSVHTNQRMAAGGTKISVEVYGAIGTSQIAPHVLLTADDNGRLNGFGFRKHTSYFIPLLRRGPQGQVNYSFACDPIGVIAGRPEADQLLRLARDHGQVVAVVGGDAGFESADPGGPVNIGIPARSFALPAIAVAIAAGTGIAIAILIRRRRHVSDND